MLDDKRLETQPLEQSSPGLFAKILTKLSAFFTRGENFAFIEGGLYVHSRRISAKLQARPGYPKDFSGKAFIRFSPRWFRGGQTTVGAILVSGFGRFGNSIIQTLNATELAHVLECQLILHHRFDLIRNSTVNFSHGITLRQTSHRLSGESLGPLILWRTRAMNGTALLSSPCSPLSSATRTAMSEALKWPQVANHSSKGSLTLHIRSGDVFSERPHPGYGQPPLSFYTRVILHNRPTKVVLLLEDNLNPVAAKLVSWCQARGIPVTKNSGGLESAVSELLAAGAVAAGRGTFVPAALSLKPKERDIYLFEPGSEPLLCDRLHTIYEVRDADGKYAREILDHNWNNTPAQKKLMVSYPEASLTDVSKRKS